MKLYINKNKTDSHCHPIGLFFPTIGFKDYLDVPYYFWHQIEDMKKEYNEYFNNICKQNSPYKK